MSSRMRINKSARNKRRSQIKVIEPRLSVDAETSSIHLRHRVDLKTGLYRGRQVINVAAREDKKAKRAQRRAQEQQQEQVTEEVVASNDSEEVVTQPTADSKEEK